MANLDSLLAPLALSALLSVTTPTLAFAQTPNVEELLRVGVQQRQEGRDEAALATFRQAWAQRPEPRVRVQIALAEQALGRWAQAFRDLRAALASPDAWVEQRRGPLEESLATITARVARLRVEGGVEGAAVLVNGTELGRLPLSEAEALDPGEVTLEVRAEGRAPWSRRLTLEAGREVVERVTLQPVAPVVVTPPVVGPPRVTPARGRGDVQRLFGWTLLAGGAVGLGLGLTGTVVRDGAVDNYNDDPLCPGRLSTSQPSSCQALIDRGNTGRLFEQIGYSVGGVALLTGIVLLLTAPSGARSTTTTSLRCGLGPGGAGLTCLGRF